MRGGMWRGWRGRGRDVEGEGWLVCLYLHSRALILDWKAFWAILLSTFIIYPNAQEHRMACIGGVPRYRYMTQNSQ